MTNWVVSIPVGDVFAADDELPFTEARDRLVSRIRAAVLGDAPIRRVLDRNGANLERLDDLLFDLAHADSADNFDFDFDRLYDWADDNRVFIDPFALPISAQERAMGA